MEPTLTIDLDLWIKPALHEPELFEMPIELEIFDLDKEFDKFRNFKNLDPISSDQKKYRNN
jgi:hypothetical protein